MGRPVGDVGGAAAGAGRPGACGRTGRPGGGASPLAGGAAGGVARDSGVSPGGRVGRGRSVARDEMTRPVNGAGGGGGGGVGAVGAAAAGSTSSVTAGGASGGGAGDDRLGCGRSRLLGEERAGLVGGRLLVLAGRGLGRRLLGCRLLHRLRLLGLLVADQPLALRLAADAVGLSIDDARGVRLHPDTQCEAQVEAFLVGESELFRELMDTKFRCQDPVSALSFAFVPVLGGTESTHHPRACGVALTNATRSRSIHWSSISTLKARPKARRRTA